MFYLTRDSLRQQANIWHTNKGGVSVCWNGKANFEILTGLSMISMVNLPSYFSSNIAIKMQFTVLCLLLISHTIANQSVGFFWFECISFFKLNESSGEEDSIANEATNSTFEVLKNEYSNDTHMASNTKAMRKKHWSRHLTDFLLSQHNKDAPPGKLLRKFLKRSFDKTLCVFKILLYKNRA